MSEVIRIPTGNLDLDILLDGGFKENSMILVAGNPGAGKTILSSFFIYDGAVNHNEPGVYACFAETKKRLLQDIIHYPFNNILEKVQDIKIISNLLFGGKSDQIYNLLNKLLNYLRRNGVELIKWKS